MDEILDETLEQLHAGRAFALVTLVADQGSTPRAAGAEMLVRDDGSIAGSIGGGLIEHTMMAAAAAAIAERRSRRERADLGGEDVANGDKMVCGGAAEVLVTFVPPRDAELLAVCRALREARDAGRRTWYVTVPPAGDDGPISAPVEHCLLDERGELTGAAVCEAAALRRLTAAAALHGTATLPDGREAVLERVDPPALAVVCGAGHVGRAVAPLLAGLGFRVVVVDDREDFASAERFPGAEVVVRPFAGALAAVGVDEHAYVVTVTRGHVHDLDVCAQALRAGARYVGVMGSRAKRARMHAALRAAGFDEAAVGRVHSPIGVAIGAETPAELAVSIAAELVQVRAGAGA
ncbi:MAG: XdhC family protein [Deltaproteobacteria bacterium]